LSCPSDDGLLQSQDQVLVLDCSLKIRKVLIWDIEISLAFALIVLLIKISHKLMQLLDELFLDTIWPSVLSKNILDVVSVHLVKEIFQWIKADTIEDNALIQVGFSDFAIPLLLDKECDLIVLSIDVLIVEFRRVVVADSEFTCIEAVPEEQLSLVSFLKELLEPVVMVLLPVVFCLKLVQMFLYVGDHE
jgi:hypothetical protein